MSGEWIAMQIGLENEIEVIQLSQTLGLNRWDVCGRLLSLWGWFDQHTADGWARGVSAEYFDRELDHPGFCRAVESVGWLKIYTADVGPGPSVIVTKFDRWMGQSGKKRLADNRRKANKRLEQKRTKSGRKAGPQYKNSNNTNNNTVQDLTSGLPG